MHSSTKLNHFMIITITLIIALVIFQCSDFYFYLNTKLNELRNFICLSKSEVSVERISVCDVTKNLIEHGIHCLPCSYTCTNGIINMLA